MVRVIDEKGRVFGYVNIIDLMVALFLLALIIAGLVLVFGGGPGTDESDQSTATIEVRAEEIQPYIATAIPDEGKVDEEEIIRIERKTVTPAEVVVADKDGELHFREHPRLKTLELRVTVATLRADDEITFSGQSMDIGSKVTLDFGNVEISGIITDIELPS